MKRLEDVLEEIKQQGNYAVSLKYGEGVGCDDLSVDQEERSLQIVMTPVGYLGEVKKLWLGKLKDVYTFDFTQEATAVSNPPKTEEIPEPGYYLWGTETAVADYKEEEK